MSEKKKIFLYIIPNEWFPSRTCHLLNQANYTPLPCVIALLKSSPVCKSQTTSKLTHIPDHFGTWKRNQTTGLCWNVGSRAAVQADCRTQCITFSSSHLRKLNLQTWSSAWQYELSLLRGSMSILHPLCLCLLWLT